eukprot:TRINITY_DN4188_c0_g1_i2.p1 TRINITY_DN4188_c0_g1~~TRINITY_DN4188_c0_g1_i2.p1  ORF type:complete len:223 (+),score=38.31 TRINITY_DN4188_c0_g1_i2:182-850(+)
MAPPEPERDDGEALSTDTDVGIGSSSTGVWIFGYGSLIWKNQNLNCEKKMPGFIKGFERRFYQGSTDHRGYPGKPGRVVTLIPYSGAADDGGDGPGCVHGIVFFIPAERVEETMKYLDHREKGGYDRNVVSVCERGTGHTITNEAILFHATEDNPEFLGPAPAAAIAKQIYDSTGPSGPNRAYLLNLAVALRAMDLVDQHVFELESMVKQMIIDEEGQSTPS